MITLFPLRTINSRWKYGFTIMEALVSTLLTSVIMTIILESVIVIKSSYLADVVRTRIRSNLRSAMDIVSMNIRQAGENLPSSFPALVLEDGGEGQSDTLKLRRALIPEVLTLCSNAASGQNTLLVSSVSLKNAGCVAGNVDPVYQVFENLRLDDEDQSIRVFIWDRRAKQGEFLDYTNGGFDSGQHHLDVSPLQNAYSQLDASIYVIEEYSFSLNALDKTLELIVDDLQEEPRPIAFSVTAIDVLLHLDDGSTISSLGADDEHNWKDLERVDVELSGDEVYKGATVSASINGQYFPRNVLSYE